MSFAKRYAVACAIAYGLIASATLVFLATTRESKSRELVARATGICGIFAEHIDRLFTNIYWMTEVASDAYRNEDMLVAELRDELKRINSRDEFSLQLSIVNRQGRLVASSISAGSGEDLSDREHIKVHLQDGGPNVFVSKPLVGRVSRQLSINITRRIYDSDGQWKGIAVVSYDPRKLGSFFEKHDLGSDDVIFLAHLDGIMVARSKGGDLAVGRQLSSTALFKEHISRGETSGVIVATSSFDNVERQLAFQVLKPVSLVVAAGISHQALQSELNLYLALAVSWLALLAAAMVGGGIVLSKYLIQLQATQEARVKAAEAEQLAKLMQSSFESSGILAVIFNDQNELIFLNRTTSELIEEKDQDSKSALEWLLGEAVRTKHNWRGTFSHHLNTERSGSRTILWSVAPADWVSRTSRLAVGFDRTEIEASERALYQKARLTTLGEMSTGLAHELAQPLTVISFASNMLAKGGAPEQRDLIELLSVAAKRVAGTVERMKVFGRRDAVGAKTRFNMRDCCENVRLLTENELKSASIELTVSMPDGDLIAAGDGTLIEQVLLNLVLNARDAINNASPAVELRQVRISAGRLNGHSLYLRVADSGPGISAAVRERLFQPFYTTKSNGSGLGLALSYGIVAELGGSIRAVEVDQGATFEIVLPLVQIIDEEGLAGELAVA